MEHTEITLSVRALVEFAYSSGSLEPGFRSGAAMAEGTRSHQLIQKQYKEGDRKEVYLKTGIPYGDLLFQIDGRCDGLLTAEDGSLTVEEIKSMAGIPDPALEGKEVHWAQAYMYAYMLATELELPYIQVKLTYVQRGSEAQYSLYREMSREALDGLRARDRKQVRTVCRDDGPLQGEERGEHHCPVLSVLGLPARPAPFRCRSLYLHC